MKRLALICAVLFARTAHAQQPAPASSVDAPEFFPRYEFHLSAASLAIDDNRFSWDTHFGGSLDFIDYSVGRFSARIDYEAVLGREFRSFDPNQGIYTLELSTSGRVGGIEVAGLLHHVSRHLGDRAKRFPIDWNAVGARVLRKVHAGGATADLEATVARIVTQRYVDYVWRADGDAMVRRPLAPHVGLFGHGSFEVFGVDHAVAGRGTQVGGLIEGGVRFDGPGGALELFGGFENRVDADPVDRQSQHWALAGFRFASPLTK